MFNRRIVLIVLILLMVVLSACAPNSPTPSPQVGSLDQAPFTLAAKAALSKKLNITQDQVSFVSAKLVEWSDSCLGLGGPAESCAQVITPGYNVVLKAQGTSFEVHTDETGSIVRIKE